MIQDMSVLKKRVYAFTADLSIIVVSNYFLMAAFTHFVQTVFFHFPMKMQLFLINKMGVMSSISLMSLTFAYFSLFYFITNGRTMGKTLMGLKVVNTDKSELTLGQSMFRALAYFTCAMFGSFLFALSYIRKDQKSLADVFSGTHVTLDTPDSDAGTEFELVLVEAGAAEATIDKSYYDEKEAA
ncbi:RDD family protein [Bacteriovorax stolpii]|uniref:RDD domain-containing protein n=1 Tax=Bacteriovorax stolpii TaxID=960 RepID=A0A2K9NQ62_BACTC|nr:RDD family protein [Bacteriovorax stolpii]AUN97195.1 hypothetical protein C0V70_03535 [Bacteriovorax stolpii]QDK42866.1 RDD family protein [Bacteriovorax stolpii]TDP53482.1 putative RDD family membrane protein YckC [Bacteriovorax stolpii]